MQQQTSLNHRQRPGVRIGLGADAGMEPASLALAQYAAWPLMLALVLALAFAFALRETYPEAL